MKRMQRGRNRLDDVPYEPFLITTRDKTAIARQICVAMPMINACHRKPRHARQVVMNGVKIVVEEQKAPGPRRFVDH